MLFCHVDYEPKVSSFTCYHTGPLQVFITTSDADRWHHNHANLSCCLYNIVHRDLGQLIHHLLFTKIKISESHKLLLKSHLSCLVFVTFRYSTPELSDFSQLVSRLICRLAKRVTVYLVEWMFLSFHWFL